MHTYSSQRLYNNASKSNLKIDMNAGTLGLLAELFSATFPWQWHVLSNGML